MYLASSNIYEFYHSVLPIVGLTIGGTYLLFTQGSTVVLKALQNEKIFYTYPNMFVLSNLIYKMKDNARFICNFYHYGGSIFSSWYAVRIFEDMSYKAVTSTRMLFRMRKREYIRIMSSKKEKQNN